MTESQKDDKDKKSTSELWALGITILGGFIFAVAILWYLASNYFELGNKLDSDLAAKAGDFIGGIIGSIWALAGVLLVYSALQAQRKDFRTNLDALKNQIDEYKEQKGVLMEQSTTLKIQRFENSFYQLLDHYLKIVHTLKLYSSNPSANREGFSLINDKFQLLIDQITKRDVTLARDNNCRRFINVEPESDDQAITWIKDEVTEFFRLNKDLFHFISLFYSLVNYIGKTANTEDKEFYMNVLLQTNSEKSNMIIAFHLFTFNEHYDTTKGYLITFGSALIDQMSIIQNDSVRAVMTNFYTKSTYFPK